MQQSNYTADEIGLNIVGALFKLDICLLFYIGRKKERKKEKERKRVRQSSTDRERERERERERKKK